MSNPSGSIRISRTIHILVGKRRMTKKILFIQGAGEGVYYEDKALAGYLKNTLGPWYMVTYPKFSGLEHVEYDAWRQQISSQLADSDGEMIIVAHSLGGSALLKYLSEESVDLSSSALFIVAAPYKCTDGEWGTDDFAIDVDFASSLPHLEKITLYHSRDDEWVPFSHMARCAEKLPHATVRDLDGRGHSFSEADFVELIEDIESLHKDSAIDGDAADG